MKTRYIAIFALLALAGCSREGFRDNSFQDKSLTATIDGSVASTKAILVDNPGVRMQAKWQENDCIGIFGNGAANVKFSIAKGDISEDGKTAKFSSGETVPSGDLTSYSPYQEGAAVNSGTITVNFPAKQAYSLRDGVVQPDPATNIMVGTGSAANGITFRNAMAVLKIGQVFDTATLLKSIEFRDLSGKAVCGSMNLTWNGGAPKAEITGSGTTITLDLGEGVSLDAGQLGTFFIVVPARVYEKGFELTFIADGGAKTVKTVGTTQGKTLDRSVVYMIGDLTAKKYVEGATSQLKSTAQVMTPEKMDKVKVLEAWKTSLVDENGKDIEDFDGHKQYIPRYTLLVHKDLNPVEGGWLVFEDETDDLPKGGVFRIKTCTRSNDDYFEVVAYPELNPVAAFESVVAGEQMVDASGNVNPEKGVPLDITPYIKSIVDDSGDERYLHVTTDGRILLSEEDVQDMVDIATKATKPHSHTFNSPKMSGNVKGSFSEISFGASMTFDTKLAIGIMQGELQYVCLNVKPKINLSSNITVKGEGYASKDFRLFTITTHPIPVAPGVAVVFEIVFTAKMGVGGGLQASASASATGDLGSYTLSYNKGDGLIFRNDPHMSIVPGSMEAKFNGFTGYVYGNTVLGARSSISIWGWFGLGVCTDYTLKLGFEGNDGSGGGYLGEKFALTHELEFSPLFTSFFWSHKFENLTTKVEFDPLWEKYFIPKAYGYFTSTIFNYSEKEVQAEDDKHIIPYYPITSVKEAEYQITLEGDCINEVNPVLLVYYGSKIEYTDHQPEKEFNLALYQKLGIEHLYPLTVSDHKLIDPKMKQVIELGTYHDDTVKQEFKGTIPFSVPKGQPFALGLGIKFKDHVIPVYGSMTAAYEY